MPATMVNTDPTDFGNEPGKGPLRVGGENTTSPSREGDRPDKRSPASEAQQPAVGLCRDTYGGNQKIRKAGETYLPKHPGEKPMEYSNRLERSVFFNFTKETVKGLSGLIYRKDPVLSDDVPAPIKGHWENIDLAGMHGDVFAKELTDDALQAGHAAILVDFPVVDETLNREAESEIRPYWVPIKKEDIMSWRTTVRDGRTVLTQVVIRIQKWVADGKFGEKLSTEYLVQNRDFSKEWATWRLLAVTKQNIVVQKGMGEYTNQPDIPLAEVITSGRESMFVSTPPLLDFAFLNIAHYQMWSDYATSIHKTCVPVLVLTGVDTPTDDNGQELPGVVVGPNTVLTLSNAQAKAYYASHDGASLGSVETALNDLKSDMGTLGVAMLAPQKRTAETAEAKRLDKSTSDSALATVARGVQDAIEQALLFHARYMGLDAGGSVTINRDFEGLLMDAPVMSAYAQLRNAGFPARPILQALQAGGRIPEDEDLEMLELEMEANRLADTEREEMEADEAEA